jgi:hypothetical protein
MITLSKVSREDREATARNDHGVQPERSLSRHSQRFPPTARLRIHEKRKMNAAGIPPNSGAPSRWTGVTANCFHPGLVATEFNRNNGLLMGLAMTVLRPVSRSPEKGAETLVWLATSPDIANVSGRYFFDQEQRPPSPEAQDAETARRLWEISERQCTVSGRSAEARS